MPDSPEIDLLPEDAAGRNAWAAAMARVRRETLEQSWAYGAAVAAVSRFRPQRWLIGPRDAPIGLAQAFVGPLGPACSPWKLVRLVRGPLFVPGLPAETRQAALRAIRAAYPRGPLHRAQWLWWLPELNGGSLAEAEMAALGMQQMVTGWSSLRLDLTLPAQQLRARLDGKWRNALKAAEKAPLRIVEEWNDTAFAALMQAHDVQRIEKRFLGPDGAFYRAFAAACAPTAETTGATEATGTTGAAGESAHLFTAYMGGQTEERPAAGLLVLRHGRGATYAAGWSGTAGRLLRAHHRLLWHALLALQAMRVEHFDLGGANTEEGAGVARFKLGLNGEVFTLAGSYL